MAGGGSAPHAGATAGDYAPKAHPPKSTTEKSVLACYCTDEPREGPLTGPAPAAAASPAGGGPATAIDGIIVLGNTEY